MHNPKLAKVMGPLGSHFRTGHSLSERGREIAVNVILAKWASAYPTNAHERAGKAAGLPADKIFLAHAASRGWRAGGSQPPSGPETAS